MDTTYGSASLGLALPERRVDEMNRPFQRFTPRQTHWIDMKAGRFAIPHVSLGGYLIFVLLWENFGNLLSNDFVWKALAILVAVTVLGTLVIYFVAQSDVRDSERYARNSYWLAVAYLCFILAVIGISWPVIIIGPGNAIVSFLYFAGLMRILVFARRTYRELRADREWASMR